jgi:hypothetical protein
MLQNQERKGLQMKKARGDVSQYLATLIGVLVILAISLAAVNYMGVTVKYITANQIARKYMLRIESDGYLSPANQDRLVNELTETGLSSVNLQGTTVSAVGNGGDVFLTIAFDQNIRKLTLEGAVFSFRDVRQRVVITRSSTSKIL